MCSIVLGASWSRVKVLTSTLSLKPCHVVPELITSNPVLPHTPATSPSQVTAWASAGESSQCLWRMKGCYTAVQCFKPQTTGHATALNLHAVDLAKTLVLGKKSQPEKADKFLCYCHLAPSGKDEVRLVFVRAPPCSHYTSTISSSPKWRSGGDTSSLFPSPLPCKL